MGRRSKRLRNRLVGGAAALVVLVLRATCRVRILSDVRPQLRAEGVPYAYALLHAHQVAAVLANDEPRGGLAAMVSRSADGDVLLPALRLCGVRAVRGSTQRRGKDKGGLRALEELRQLLEARVAVLLAVDGPQGPRNAIHRGVTVLPRQVDGAVVLPLVVVPSRRWVLSRTWDRMQIPKPFSTIEATFALPIDAGRGESSALIRERIARSLEDLEMRCDPDEARLSLSAEAAMARGASAEA
jgi:lysophospholipid acyltransferase (LPLAT)-like uncharacterized protein